MSRNKTNALKRKTININHGPLSKMEKEFLSAPAKLVAHLSKEIIMLKKNEKHLKNAASQNQHDLKAIQKQLKQAAKNKSTSAGKKQLMQAKKSQKDALRVQALLAKELKQIAKSLTSATEKQSKLAALRKHLKQFNKDWAQESKKVKAGSKKTTKTKVKKIHAKKPADKKEAMTRSEPSQQDSMSSEMIVNEDDLVTS